MCNSQQHNLIDYKRRKNGIEAIWTSLLIGLARFGVLSGESGGVGSGVDGSGVDESEVGGIEGGGNEGAASGADGSGVDESEGGGSEADGIELIGSEVAAIDVSVKNDSESRSSEIARSSSPNEKFVKSEFKQSWAWVSFPSQIGQIIPAILTNPPKS